MVIFDHFLAENSSIADPSMMTLGVFVEATVALFRKLVSF